MTSHELAKKLLEGPDVAVLHRTREVMEDGEEFDRDDELVSVIFDYGQANVAKPPFICAILQ